MSLRALHSARLFPEIPPLVEAILFTGLRGAPDPPPPWEWAGALPMIVEQRLAALALRFIAQSEGATTAPPAVEAELRSSAFAWSSRAGAAVSAARVALRALSDDHLPFVVTKGPGIASVYPAIGDRPFSDVDILVPRQALAPARAVLHRLGFERPASEREPWALLERETCEAINLRTATGGNIDLHRQIPPWWWGRRMTYESVAERAVPTVYFGVELPCACAEDNLLISALHVVSDRNRPGASLIIWRDLLQLAAVADPGVLRRRAAQFELEAWLEWIGQRLPADVRPDLGPPSGKRVQGAWRITLLMPPRIGSRTMISQPLRLPAWRGLIYVIGRLLPSPSWIRLEYPQRRGLLSAYFRWWRQSAASLRRS